MKKHALALLLAALLIALCACSAVGEAQTNLLSNGGFETLDADGGPTAWYETAYRNQAGYSRLRVTDERAHGGRYSACVENASMNDARFTCTVTVEPETLYRLSGYVLVESMQSDGNGANFGIESIYAHSDGLFDTGGEWQYVEWYGETDIDQTELTLGVRVGGYSAESVGKAYFDDIALEKVDELPPTVIASVWYSTAAAQSQQTTESDEPQKSTLWFLLCAAAFALLYMLCKRYLDDAGEKRLTLVFVCLLLLALALRCVLAASVEGYSVDVNCFTAWSMRMASVGPAGFYSADYFCDYPPGYMLLLWPCGALLNAVGYSNAPAALLIVKSIPILFDLLGAMLLYAYGKKRLGDLPALLLSALYLFNPAVLVNGAAWGQVDSVLAMLMALTAIAAMDKRWRVALPLFFVSVLVKPQALLFAPVGGMWLVYALVKEPEARRKAGKDILIGLGLSLAACAAIVLPFSVGQDSKLGWLVKLYSETLSSYPYATLNTANLYYLLGANWKPLLSEVPIGLLIGTALASAGLGGWLLWRSKRTDEKLKLSQKQPTLALLCALLALAMVALCFAGATYTVYGYAMMAFVFLFAIACLWFDGRAGALPFYMALALIGVYVVGVKVHERYLFPALLLLLVSYVRLKDKRILWLLVGLSVTTFINTAIVLDNSILFGSSMGHLNADTLALNDLLCAANIALMGFTGYIAVAGVRESAPKAVPQADDAAPGAPSSYERMLLAPKDARLRLTLRDYLIMGVTAVLYSVLAFANLGSTVAPQDGWVSTSADEQIIFELDESQTFKFMYYAGVSYNSFSIAVSEDGQSWSTDFPCKMNEGMCYCWNYALQSETIDGEPSYAANSPSGVLWLKGKYLRLNACEAGLNLFEIAVRNQSGENLPLRVAQHLNGHPELLGEPKPAQNLINEQDTCVGEPGYYTGMYFDEIYHARTAYEHLHGQVPYETTHPPLGKLMMSVGIAIFGMTPFGWRFAGALIGVLMLPALYLLALQLTKKRDVATFSMLAFTFDLLHYSQTRIATIDSFPVFFIILTYLCMVRYMQTDVFAVANGEKPRLFTRAYRRSLLPLLLCGIFMGMSIASKWIGLYSAVGLALLFFLTMYRQYRVGLAACAIDPDEADGGRAADEMPRVRSARDYALKRILVTCGFCVLFFIVVPCVIYYLSYIPYLSPSGPVTIKRIIAVQKGMLSYHSKPGLGMDHPFQSPWWQWPLMMKPLWFSQDHFEPEGWQSTIMCMGNPWVFYIGAVCMIAVLVAFIRKYVRLRGGVGLKRGDGNLTLTVLVIGFLAQYLPWTLVPRSMYMYHYFASVPFIILATAWAADRLPESRMWLRRGVMGAYLLIAAGFFVFYFPYASGWLTPVGWLDTAKECFSPKIPDFLTTPAIRRFINSYFKIYY